VEDFSNGVGGGWKRTHDPNETTIIRGIPYNRYHNWKTWSDIDPMNETMNRAPFDLLIHGDFWADVEKHCTTECDGARGYLKPKSQHGCDKTFSGR
jgi:hypothetical protein